MRKGVLALPVFAVAVVFFLSGFQTVKGQELPLELRWSTTCPDTISNARLTDRDDDGQTEFAYTSVIWNTRRYLRIYTITPDSLVRSGQHTLPTPDGFWPFGQFDLRDINSDGEFDMLVGYGIHRVYIVYGPDFTVGNYYAFVNVDNFSLNSVDIGANCSEPTGIICYGGWQWSHTYYFEWNACRRFILPDFGLAGRLSDACRLHWQGIDNFSGTVYLFSNYYFYEEYPYPWWEITDYGFTIADEFFGIVDLVLWEPSGRREKPICFAGQLDSDSEIEFLMSHELTLRCYDLREGDLDLKWYRDNTADEYLSALDVTGDGIEEAIVGNSEGQIWAIEGEYGNTIAAGSIGHQVSNMFFTKHQETGRNFLICYENGDQPILYLYEIGSPTVIDEDNYQESKPKDFTLKQNYPNPFNSRTQIEYFLNRDGDISLEVFDLAGSHVATIQEGRQKAGKHAIEWNGEGFASGIYFYRLISRESTQTRKMILLK
jgi:hypothetical protein